MAEKQAELQKIYDDTGGPGAAAFRALVLKRGLPITAVEAQAFVRAQSAGQLFQGRIKSDGKVTASRENSVWQADLIDYSKKSLTGNRFILTVVDDFSRRLPAEAIPNKQPTTVLDAFKKLARGHRPEQVTTDQGAEWGHLFMKYLDSVNIAHATKDVKQIKALAVVDRAIGKYKTILKNLVAKGGTWSEKVKQAEAIFNERPKEHMMGASPDEVDKNAVLGYQLEKEAGADIRFNNEKWRDRVRKLHERGAFRAPLPRAEWESIEAPKFGGKVHHVKSIMGAIVEDTEGHRFPVKQVMAVPGTSEDVHLPEPRRTNICPSIRSSSS